MRSILAAAGLCLLALAAVGAHHAEAFLAPVHPVAATQRGEDGISSALLRHRAAQPPHWGAMVLVPRPPLPTRVP